jgi:hypothetical protein
MAGRMSIEKSNDLIGYRTRNLSACDVVPPATTLPRVPRDQMKRQFNTSVDRQNNNFINDELYLN